MARPDTTAAVGSHGSPFDIGAKRSWVPVIGEIEWEIPKEKETIAYYAYICRIGDGRQIGYVRVPDYNASKDAGNVGSVVEKGERRHHPASFLTQEQLPRSSGGQRMTPW